MLENTPALSNETLSELSRLIKEGGFMRKVAAARQKEPGDVGLSLYEIFQASEDRLSLDLNLLTRNFSCDPVYHSNGGVADFKVIHAGETLYASKLFRTERLVQLLDKWENMTGQTPAYKITAAQEAKERELLAKQRELREQRIRYDGPRQSQGFKMKM